MLGPDMLPFVAVAGVVFLGVIVVFGLVARNIGRDDVVERLSQYAGRGTEEAGAEHSKYLPDWMQLFVKANRAIRSHGI